MGKINTNNYPNRPVSSYQDDDMFVLQDNGGETYTTNVGDIKTLIDNRVNDSNLVHKTGDETILGNKTFEDDINVEGGITAGTTSTFNDIDLDGSSIYGVGTLNVNQIDVHDGQAVEFLTDITVNGDVTDEDGNVLSNKTDKVENATSGHLAGLDSNGNLTDSGVSPTEDVTVEGNPVTFESPFEQDAKNVVVSVKPIQDLHGYDHPWVGGAGKNKCPYDNVSFTSGSTWCNLTGGAASSLLQGSQVALKADTYYISMPTNTNIDGMQVADSNENVLVNSKNGSFTLATDGTVYIRVKQEVASQPTTCKIQIETGSSATSWEPYSNICPISGIDEVEIGVSDGESAPTTTTIPLPSTLYDADVDVTEGDVRSTKAKDALVDFTWLVNSTGEDYIEYKTTISDKAYGVSNYISDSFGVGDGLFELEGRANTSLISVKIPKTVATNLTEFNTWLSNLNPYICYELATPTTLSFTPTDVELLEGTNVVSTNAEKVAVTYGRSLWQDIDKLKTDTEGKLNKSDVATIEGDTASRPYAVNEFMLRADGLYKVTQPIAQNASITSSNTTKTTVGEVLTALLNA